MIAWARKPKGKRYHAWDLKRPGATWAKSLCGAWYRRAALVSDPSGESAPVCQRCMRQAKNIGRWSKWE